VSDELRHLQDQLSVVREELAKQRSENDQELRARITLENSMKAIHKRLDNAISAEQMEEIITAQFNKRVTAAVVTVLTLGGAAGIAAWFADK